MEAENDEATKRHYNTFSLKNILFIVQVSAALAVAGYCGYLPIVSLLEGFILWFDWFRLVLRNIFFIFIILNVLIGSIYFTFPKATVKKKPSLYDDYITAVPSVIRSSPEPSFAPVEVGDYGGVVYYYNTPPFQAVNTVEENGCYERVVMEMDSKSCKRTTRSEKKMKKTRSTVEYQRTESERVMKTASLCRLHGMMDGLSSEEFRMTVETFIMEKKNIYDWRNCCPQLQNGVADQWQNGFHQWQNGGVHQWQNCVPQLQNGGFDQWQNCVPQLQGQTEYDGTGRHRSSRSHGPYLAISN
ncbi:hypothetical protein N665_0944s0022 [Sinapis alba]|nr:hypothetical protein N665_0944s0022 [Sinapis alba]